jgi:hypothetical protein
MPNCRDADLGVEELVHPCFAVRQICTTVERSMPHFAAASRWVHCSVSTATHIWYFSLGDNRRGFREITVRSDAINSLLARQARRPVAGLFRPEMAHKVDAKQDARDFGVNEGRLGN